MTTAEDYLESVLKSLVKARLNIALISTAPREADTLQGYARALPNPADRTCIRNAYCGIDESITEVEAALKILRSNDVPREVAWKAPQ